MPKGMGYGKRRKGGLGGKRKKAITAASFTRWAKRQAAARKKRKVYTPPKPKRTYGMHKGSQGRGRKPPPGYKSKKVTGTARPVSGLRRFKKKRRTLKKL